MTIPRLAKGRGYKGPEFYGCMNTGMAPAIFHSRTGKYLVGPEIPCRDAMRAGVTLTNARKHGEGRRQVRLYKTRGPAAKRFAVLCNTAEIENEAMRQDHRKTAALAAKGDIGAALHLGDF